MSSAGFYTPAMANLLAQGFLNGVAYDFTLLSGSLYLGMLTATDISTEITGGTYTRQLITFGTVGGTNAYAANTNAITFSGVPASNVTAWGIFSDSSTTSGLFCFPNVNASDVPVTIVNSDGDTVTIAAGVLTVQFV